MSWMQPFLMLMHLIGLAWAMGAASVKLALLLRCQRDRSFIQVYLKVVRPVTRQLVAGLVLLTLSGIGWLLVGHPLTRILVVKLVLVAAVWVMGPVIDNVAEPRFRRLAPTAGNAISPEFVRAERAYVALEAVATGMFYLIVGVWVLL
jgi:hypothetical protein